MEEPGPALVFSGPMVMGFADTALFCVMASKTDVIPVMANSDTFTGARRRGHRRGIVRARSLN